MDLNYVESLAIKGKSGDMKSKEELIKEFTPFIKKLSKNTFIKGYDRYDIENECYSYLLRALEKYDISRHKFVAYCTNTIKNNINYLIKKSITNSSENVLLIDDISCADEENIDDNLLKDDEIKEIKKCIDNLTETEYELYKFIFIDNKKLKEYAYLNNILYHTAYSRKKAILNKIYTFLSANI